MAWREWTHVKPVTRSGSLSVPEGPRCGLTRRPHTSRSSRERASSWPLFLRHVVERCSGLASADSASPTQNAHSRILFPPFSFPARRKPSALRRRSKPGDSVRTRTTVPSLSGRFPLCLISIISPIDLKCPSHGDASSGAVRARSARRRRNQREAHVEKIHSFPHSGRWARCLGQRAA